MAIRDNYIKYIDIYDSSEEVKTALDNGELHNPYVALIETASGSSIDYNTDTPTDIREIPLTIEITECSGTALGAKTFSLMSDGLSENQYYYTINGGEIHLFTFSSSQKFLQISVNKGDIIRFTVPWDQGGTNGHIMIRGREGMEYKAYGNVMSLCYANFATATTIPTDDCFRSLFSFQNQNISLIDVEKLVLPATTLKNSCYYRMFEGCSNITKAPILDFTSLPNYYNCLLMFYNCSKLNYVKCIATSITGEQAVEGWLMGVAATGTFVKDPNMNSWPSGISGIPTGWTVQDAQ